MCGIAGILRFDGLLPSGVVEAMTRRLAHRGPDGEGVYERGPVGLGHRRLSIIDPAGGQQPLFNEDGNVAVTFNGEIYNYRELTRVLKEAGHTFRTKSDTEVIVHAWEQWGKTCVERFRGMFALAVADWKRKEVFLARDHLGIKPLCYLQDGLQLSFASEIQALRVLPAFDTTIDIRAMDNYLALGYIPAPRTIYLRVSKLAPAHRLTVSFDGRTEGPEPYWSWAFDPEESKTVEQWTEELEAVLRESVRAHLVADVPFGAFLSGGMDSTAVVGWMSKCLERPVRTFTIGFAEPDYDETRYAQQAARRWGTEHHVETVSPQAVHILPDLVRHYGEPFGDSSSLPTYYVSQFARQYVPMVLSGDGGDEALGGYRRHVGWSRWIDPPPIRRPFWKQWARPILASVFPRRFPQDITSRVQSLEGWLCLNEMASLSSRNKFWRPEYSNQIGIPPDVLREAGQRAVAWPPESFARYMDYAGYLPNDILAKVDTASMMHGLEVRTPLVDVEVIKCVSRIPARFTFASREDGGWDGKILLRRILGQYFPEEFIERPKRGFMVPLEKWFGTSGELRPMLDERLSDHHSRLQDFFRLEELRERVKAPMTRRTADQLWQLLFLELWLEQSN